MRSLINIVIWWLKSEKTDIFKIPRLMLTSIAEQAGLKSYLVTRKPTEWPVRPAKTEISLGTWRKLGSLATHWAHSEDWSDWAESPDWSESLLGAHVILLVLSCGGSYVTSPKTTASLGLKSKLPERNHIGYPQADSRRAVVSYWRKNGH